MILHLTFFRACTFESMYKRRDVSDRNSKVLRTCFHSFDFSKVFLFPIKTNITLERLVKTFNRFGFDKCGEGRALVETNDTRTISF